ncbi:MAG: hypothetical protein EBZ48_03055, partial [Proteobacteria bacterium]|nr:hypothetical protein [Pseudomonadota bacterium]
MRTRSTRLPAFTKRSKARAFTAQAETEQYESPLRFITSDPSLHELISYLDQCRKSILANPKGRHTLEFSRAKLTRVRSAFSRAIRQGEERLHKLCELICDSYLDHYQVQSVAIGEVESTRKRFTFTESITCSELYSTTDLDLGNRQLSRLRYFDGKRWSQANLVANVVEYQPTEPNPQAIHRLISRIKAEEEIWNKVTDEIFRLDQLVQKDKKLRRLSWYVKDIFGLKMVVGTTRDAELLQRSLRELYWSPDTLRRYGVAPSASSLRLSFMEVK